MQENLTKKMQLHQRLFDEMLTNFDIQASDIAEVTGISEVSLSKFRRGKADLGTAKFLAILAILPDEAREWYVSQILGAKPKTNLRLLVSEASPQEKAEVLNAIASWAQNVSTTEASLVSAIAS